jgi:selenocysteine-specific elongation factor
VLHLERPLLCPPSSLYIASRLDTDIHSNTCRLAFYGHVAMPLTKASYKQACHCIMIANHEISRAEGAVR